MEFGLAVIIGVAVISAAVGSLMTKGCCGTKKDKTGCDSAVTPAAEKPIAGLEDLEKERAIDELMSKKDPQ